MKAKAQAAQARELARRAAAAGPRPPRRSACEAWLDERDARRPLTRTELRSANDERAAAAVEAGGGMEAATSPGRRWRGSCARSCAVDPGTNRAAPEAVTRLAAGRRCPSRWTPALTPETRHCTRGGRIRHRSGRCSDDGVSQIVGKATSAEAAEQRPLGASLRLPLAADRSSKSEQLLAQCARGRAGALERPPARRHGEQLL